ncbi:hypothetical protein [Gloeocapsopsis sp. IPPAS B-1203]|nr:hypothetical protein [Gloeocapsopsis sp. IPPAS B-1203]
MRRKWRTASTGFLCTLLLLLVTSVWSLASCSGDQVIIGANNHLS